MTYVDGFVIPLPVKNLDSYREQASAAGKIWMEHGALMYKECIAEDLDSELARGSFPKITGTKTDETIVFAFIIFNSREHRDEVNAKVMADPRINELCDKNSMPFEVSRMAYGGFKTIVDL